MIQAVLLPAALILLAYTTVDACVPGGITVTSAGPAPSGNASSAAYTQAQVEAALGGYRAYTGRYVNPSKVTFSCVDSRGGAHDDPDLESPGGDIAELLVGMVIYHRLTGIAPTEESVETEFNRFMKTVVNPSRPFYYHTADDKAQYAFNYVYNKVGGERPVVLPAVAPEDSELAEIWLEALSQSGAQGCGHLRLIMASPAEYGLAEEEVHIAKWLIKAFYKFWWWTPLSSPTRHLISHPFLRGALDGRATVLVQNEGPSCLSKAVEMYPSHGGSEVFIYQAAAASTMRAEVIKPFFKRCSKDDGNQELFNGAEFYKQLEALHATMLGATLRLLSPLKDLPLWLASVETTTSIAPIA